jgi:hypothetical protein
MRRNYFGMLLVFARMAGGFAGGCIGNFTRRSRRIPNLSGTIPREKNSDTILIDDNYSYLTVSFVSTNFVPRFTPNQKSNTKKAHR